LLLDPVLDIAYETPSDAIVYASRDEEFWFLVVVKLLQVESVL
jgi:hypothetical protein